MASYSSFKPAGHPEEDVPSTKATESVIIDISLVFIACLHLHKSLLALLQRGLDKGDDANLASALNIYGRLRIWGEETRAILPSSSRGSLDDALRKDPKLKGIATRTLQRLKRKLELAIAAAEPSTERPLVRGEHADPGTESESSEDSGSEDEDKLPKLGYVLKRMADDINSLYQLSLLVNRPGFNRRYIHSTGNHDHDPRVAHYAFFDLRHVEQKLLQWKNAHTKIANEEELRAPVRESASDPIFATGSCEYFLTERLAVANTKRREQPIYWSRHPDIPPPAPDLAVADLKSAASAGEAPVVVTAAPQRDPLAIPEDTKSIVAKTVMTKQTFTTVARTDVLDAQTESGPQRTIYAETTVGNMHSNRVPALPKAAELNLTFECPYCHIKIRSGAVKSRQNWKRHVFRDLRPYVCTFKDCDSSDKQYLTRGDWIYHERQMHRRRWVCVEHGEQCFHSKEDFVHHLVHSHANATSSQQVNVLSEISERQVEDSEIFPCPFCQAQKRLKQLEAHVAEHLESIALFVLPSDGDDQEGEGDGNSQGVGAANNSSQSISSFSFTDSDRRAAASGGQNTGRLRETSSDSIVYSVVFSPDSAQLASASTDKSIELWDASSGTLLQSLEGHSGSVLAIAFSPNGKMLAASTDSTVRVWDVGSGAVRHVLEGHSNYVKCVVFSPDGRRLSSASVDKTIKLWDAGSGALLHSLEGHSGSVNAVAFSPNGMTLASASTDYTVRVWDAGSGAMLQVLEGHSNYVKCVVFSPDGRRLSSASDDETVKLWDAGSGALLQSLEGHSGSVNAVAFSPNGKTLASASTDGLVKVWEVGSGALLQSLMGHSCSVNAIAFSPDGKTLISASIASTVQIWDIRRGVRLRRIDLMPTYINQGRWKEAEELIMRVIEMRKKVLGEKHPDTLTSMANLVSTYINQGRWKEAEELDVQVIEIEKRVLGEEHPHTLVSMADLASTYMNQGRWKEAEELDVQVIEIGKRVLGEEHPFTLTSMANLASTYMNQGRWKEAEELDVQVIEMRKKVLGKKHRDTLTSMYNHAFTLKGQGRSDEAISVIELCLQLGGHVFGSQRPNMVSPLEVLNEWQKESLEAGL